MFDAVDCEPSTLAWFFLTQELTGRDPTEAELMELAPFVVVRKQ